MAESIERVLKVTVDGNAALRELQKVSAATGAVDSKLQAFGDTLKKAGAALAGAFAVNVIVGQFKSVVDSMDDIVKASQRVGVAAENLQALRYAAQASGSSAESLDKGLERLAVNLQDVGEGTTDAAKALRAFGVTAGDTTAAAFAKIADGFAQMPDGALKTSTAITLLGKAGADLIPTLNNGAKGLAEFSEEAKALGLVLSDEAIKGAEHFNDQLDMLTNVVAGAARSFVSGLLPALQSVTAELIHASQGGEGLQSWGAALGEDLVRLAMGASLVVGTLEDLMAVQEGMRKFLVSPIWEWGDIYTETSAKISANNDETIRSLERLVANWKKTRTEVEDPWRIPFELPPESNFERVLRENAAATKKLAADQKAAAEEALRVKQALEAFDRREAEARGERYENAIKLQKELNDEAGKAVDVQHMTKEALDQSTRSFEKHNDAALTLGKVYGQVADEAAAHVKMQDEQIIRLEALRSLYEKSTGPAKEWAKAQIDIINAQIEAAKSSQEQKDSMEALNSSWDRFLDSVSSGSVTVAQAFKAMAESLIADLLKIWAKKFILDAIAGMFSGGGGSVSTVGGGQLAAGGVLDAGQILPFARGGVMSQPVLMPMALMAEAGPEAVMPLKRGADGNLGVAGAAAALNVTVNNYTDASVSTQRGPGGDLQILIEATKRSLAADFRRGGNDVSRAAEAAWRLSRGNAAPF
jgi:hypothetical protein